MAKISIIVPVYNTEKYLRQCLDSIVSQTLKDIEIIIVDDGSKDSSPAICDEYAEKDDRIKVIHKVNEGLGKAYNVGIEAATADYIGFVESDDFVESIMFESLYELALKNDVDIVKSNFFFYYSDPNRRNHKNHQFNEYNSWQVFNVKDKPEVLEVVASIWSAIYKRDFINDNNIRFLNTPGASFQDVSFTFKALSLAKNMIITPDAYLYYRQDNENSSCRSKEKINDILVEYEEVDRFYDEHKDIKKVVNLNKLKKQYWDCKWNHDRIDSSYQVEFMNKVKQVFTNYVNANDIPPEFVQHVNMMEKKAGFRF